MTIFIPENLPRDELLNVSGARRLAAPVGPADAIGLESRHYFSRAFAESLDSSGHARFEMIATVESTRELLKELRACNFQRWIVNDGEAGHGLRRLGFEIDFSCALDDIGVSFVIPVFDKTADELKRAIRSIVISYRTAGLSARSEIIIIDDGSNLDISAVVAQLAGEFRFYDLRVIRNGSNKGVARSRNAGVKAARNDIVMFLDADDEIHPELVRAFVVQIQAGTDIAGSDMIIPGSGEVFIGRPQGVPEIFKRNSFGSGIALNLKSPALRRLMRFQPLYNPLFSVCYEDWELNCVLRVLGARMAVVPAPLYRYHRREAGRDTSARRFHPYFKRLLPVSAKARAWAARTCSFGIGFHT